MARRRGNKPRQNGVQQFAQSGGTSSFALQATRAMAGSAGNTGESALVGSYRRKKATKSAGGDSFNFARRGRGHRSGHASGHALGAKMATRDAAQRPSVSNRQYARAM